jgi:hypothetical protein
VLDLDGLFPDAKLGPRVPVAGGEHRRSDQSADHARQEYGEEYAASPSRRRRDGCHLSGFFEALWVAHGA